MRAAPSPALVTTPPVVPTLAPRKTGDPKALWSFKEIDAIPTSHRVRFADRGCARLRQAEMADLAFGDGLAKGGDEHLVDDAPTLEEELVERLPGVVATLRPTSNALVSVWIGSGSQGPT